MLKPMSSRMSGLIAANFAAAGIVGLEVLLSVVAYGVFAPNAASNGIVSLIGATTVFGILGGVWGSIIAFPFFLSGLIAVGIPTWWAFNSVGWTGARAFIAVAAFESVIGGASIATLIAPEGVLLAPLLALPGGVAGWVIWRFGYEPNPTPPRPPRRRWPARPS